MSDPTSCDTLWINDNTCDDDCNFPEFNYDGGDCCLDLVVSNFCWDCFCYYDCSVHELHDSDEILPPPELDISTTTLANDVKGTIYFKDLNALVSFDLLFLYIECYDANPMPMDVPNANGIEYCYDWKNDTICDDVCNVPEFQFDGGDCCLDLVASAWCSHCFCYDDCSVHDPHDLALATSTDLPNLTTTTMSNVVDGDIFYFKDLNTLICIF